MWLLVTLLLVVLSILYMYGRHRHNYWSSRGVLTPPTMPFLGHVHKLFLPYTKRWIFIEEFLKNHRGLKYSGHYEFFRPIFNIYDPELIRLILVKDFDHFVDRRNITFSGDAEIFNEMLTIVRGEKWKALRAAVSPAFSSGKIKNMFSTIQEKAQDLLTHCDRNSSDIGVDLRKAFTAYASTVIASCSFGIEAQCLLDANDEFLKRANNILSLNWKAYLSNMMYFCLPKLAKFLRLPLLSSDTKYFEDMIQDTVETRRKLKFKRGDFVDLLLEAQESDNINYNVTDKTILAESLLFLFAGFSTISDAMCFASYLLAKHKDKQDKLREELNKIMMADGCFTYQNIMEAKYLDACFSVPGTSIILPEGMLVDISVWNLHHDPDAWLDPHAFLPERFTGEKKFEINQYTYLPFGLGPRNCIGMRFALMEAKAALANLVYTFKMSIPQGYEEVQYDNNPFNTRPAKGWPRIIFTKISN